jgi:hypothetical protein
MVTDIRTGSSRVNYFNAHLDDRSSLGLVFHAGNPHTPNWPVEPFVIVHLDRPGLPRVSFESHSPVALLRVVAGGCQVRIGGDLTDARGTR